MTSTVAATTTTTTAAGATAAAAASAAVVAAAYGLQLTAGSASATGDFAPGVAGTSNEMVLSMLDNLVGAHEPIYADYPSYQDAAMTHLHHHHQQQQQQQQQQHMQQQQQHVLQQQQQQQQQRRHLIGQIQQQCRNGPIAPPTTAMSLDATTHTPGIIYV